MRALEFLTSHVIFKLRYNQIYQLKTTIRTLQTVLYRIIFKNNVPIVLHNFKILQRFFTITFLLTEARNSFQNKIPLFQKKI